MDLLGRVVTTIPSGDQRIVEAPDITGVEPGVGQVVELYDQRSSGSEIAVSINDEGVTVLTSNTLDEVGHSGGLSGATSH